MLSSDGHLAQAFQHGYPYDTLEQTQETQVSTQEASQQDDTNPVESDNFGCLMPCINTSPHPIELKKAFPEVKIGRDPINDVVLNHFRISQFHCKLTWNCAEDDSSVVTILDTSRNGTFINGSRVGKYNSAILRDGNEIAFGYAFPDRDREEDFRYCYRHMKGPSPVDPVHKKYELVDELGRGSFATVRRAMEKGTGQWWAVKIIHGSRLGDHHAQERVTAFTREIAILESLEHPNICRLKEVFMPVTDSQRDIFLVLELVEGRDLSHFIFKNEGLNEPLAIHITRQICRAMAYVHSRGIAHRDLKPENVLLTREDPPTVKVADFGLAKAVSSLTKLKTMCGTPTYVAPEVLNQTDSEGYSHLVDSWSVGLIIHSMLTNGASPFIEYQAIADGNRHISERTIIWSALEDVGISDDCRHFIQHLLEYDPATRMSLADARREPWLNPPPPPASQPFVISRCFNQTTEDSKDSIEYPDLDGADPNAPIPPVDDVPIPPVDADSLSLESLNIQSSPVASPSKGKGKQDESVSSMPDALPQVRVPLEPRNQALDRDAKEEAASSSALPETTIAGPSSPRKRGRRAAQDSIEEGRPLSKRNRPAHGDALPAAVPGMPASRKKNVRGGGGAVAPKRGTRTAVEEQDARPVRRSTRIQATKAARR
ncbi:Pkinase-domain-containing protein [Artomyces pyxidatus]|uniref:Pkinase-domain-containing protein n=1 Tax=Artomyces pyxidatus TaxID=48021 RepID=A0ACB8T9L4_9AGAM|nr:Pkinase-domain-containing protein [Artomyces pyxidatus]